MSYYQPVRGTRGHEMAVESARGLRRTGRNTDITYVPPGLTEDILAGYRKRMADVFSRKSLKGFLRRGLFRNLRRALPGWPGKPAG